MSKCFGPGLRKVLQKFNTVFREELSPGLPSEISSDHEIETNEKSKPQHRFLYQQSPADLKGMKHYVQQ